MTCISSTLSNVVTVGAELIRRNRWAFSLGDALTLHAVSMEKTAYPGLVVDEMGMLHVPLLPDLDGARLVRNDEVLPVSLRLGLSAGPRHSIR